MSAPSNPWLTIPATDYDGHMGSPAVGQAQVLNELFRGLYLDLRPHTLALLGCATGNGMEHIDPGITTRAVGVDLNPEYIELARNRLADEGSHLELRCGDLLEVDPGATTFDWIHAALIFEYVAPEQLLSRIARWLTPTGHLSVVLQLPSAATTPVTPSPFTSLASLTPVLTLHAPPTIVEQAGFVGLRLYDQSTLPLPSGKAFWLGRFVLR